MPSPSASSIKNNLAVTYTLEPSPPYQAVQTYMAKPQQFVQRMGDGMDAGWTCSSPTTPSTFQSQISSAFSDYTLGTGQGLHWINCVGSALDNEVNLWIASWDSQANLHTYTPNTSSIISYIESCQLFSSNATIKMNQTIADTFIQFFVQEVG